MEQAPTAADFAKREIEEDSSTPLANQARDHVEMLERLSTVGDFARPERPRVFVVANQKGGVGKTTTSVNIAVAMALRGIRVLLIDLDPQGNASTATNIDHGSGTRGTYEVLLEGTPIADVVQQATDAPNLGVIPATIDLAGAEIELVSIVSREQRLRRAIQEYLDTADAPADYVFIDCPPSLGLLTVNAMAAAKEVLIPIQCEYYALEGLSQLLRNIELVQQHLNPGLAITTVLLTMHDARTNLSASVSAEVRQHFGDRVLQTAIPRSVKISEAPGYQQSILTYDPSSTGALSYLEAAREITTHYPEKEG